MWKAQAKLLPNTRPADSNASPPARNAARHRYVCPHISPLYFNCFFDPQRSILLQAVSPRPVHSTPIHSSNSGSNSNSTPIPIPHPHSNSGMAQSDAHGQTARQQCSKRRDGSLLLHLQETRAPLPRFSFFWTENARHSCSHLVFWNPQRRLRLLLVSPLHARLQHADCMLVLPTHAGTNRRTLQSSPE